MSKRKNIEAKYNFPYLDSVLSNLQPSDKNKSYFVC